MGKKFFSRILYKYNLKRRFDFSCVGVVFSPQLTHETCTVYFVKLGYYKRSVPGELFNISGMYEGCKVVIISGILNQIIQSVTQFQP